MPAGTGFEHEHRPPDQLVFTGRCEVSLVRAVLPYTDLDRAGAAPVLEDLGLGVVLEAGDPSAATVLDLGSGQRRRADLNRPVVLLGWLYPGTVRALLAQVSDPGSNESQGRSGWWARALRMLDRTGFSPLTRPVFLRAGFRDLVEDVDLHESLAVRIAVADGVARAWLDGDRSALMIRIDAGEPDVEFERDLREAFPGWPVLAGLATDGTGAAIRQVEIPMARSLRELRRDLRSLRRGILHLLERYEPARHLAIREAFAGFGERDSLAAFTARDLRSRPVPSTVLGPAAEHGLTGDLSTAPTSARVH